MHHLALLLTCMFAQQHIMHTVWWTANHVSESRIDDTAGILGKAGPAPWRRGERLEAADADNTTVTKAAGQILQ